MVGLINNIRFHCIQFKLNFPLWVKHFFRSPKRFGKYTCIVCGERFDELFLHLNNNRYGMLQIHDKKHFDYYKAIDEQKTYVCFCGGNISTNFWSEDSWETSCRSCSMLYDED